MATLTVLNNVELLDAILEPLDERPPEHMASGRPSKILSYLLVNKFWMFVMEKILWRYLKDGRPLYRLLCPTPGLLAIEDASLDNVSPLSTETVILLWYRLYWKAYQRKLGPDLLTMLLSSL
jgi:hypothetical protein